VEIRTAAQGARAVGNADIYAAFAGLPVNGGDVRSVNIGNDDGIDITSPPAGAFYIGIFATEAYEDVSLSATVK
jgi:microbial collagenase